MRPLKRTAATEALIAALRELRQNRDFRSMRGFSQHGATSTYQHCLNVALLSLLLAEKLHLSVDRKSLARGALLHDFYLYDWHIPDPSHRLHGFRHARVALVNASQEFQLNRLERSIIDCHMWPMNLTRVPRCREAALVCLSDKLCALSETIRMRLKPR